MWLDQARDTLLATLSHLLTWSFPSELLPDHQTPVWNQSSASRRDGNSGVFDLLSNSGRDVSLEVSGIEVVLSFKNANEVKRFKCRGRWENGKPFIVLNQKTRSSEADAESERWCRIWKILHHSIGGALLLPCLTLLKCDLPDHCQPCKWSRTSLWPAGVIISYWNDSSAQLNRLKMIWRQFLSWIGSSFY